MPEEPKKDLSDKIIPVVVWVGGVCIAIATWTKSAWDTPGGRDFLTTWGPRIGSVFAGLVFIAGISLIWRWSKRAGPERRTAVIVFLVLPVVFTAIGATALLSPNRQILALRIVFLSVVCLLPGLIYYLFIATRKISLLNDYFINLNRLGLLKPNCHAGSAQTSNEDARTECRVRLVNYIQKFEAIYGPVPVHLRTSLVAENDPLKALSGTHLGEMSTAQKKGAPSDPKVVQVFTPEAAIPVIFASVLITLGWLLALPPFGTAPAVFDASDALHSRGFWSLFFQINEDPISYAFLGAYFFSLQMLFRRYIREDLRKSAYVAVSIRIILALIGTWAVITGVKATGRVAPDNVGLALLGFVIGVFPRVAWQFITGFTKWFIQKIGLVGALPTLESTLPVSELDGLTVWHESRLEEQDIENIPNMATADLVDLMIGTRFAPDRIIDWVDQAILYTYLGPEPVRARRARAKPEAENHPQTSTFVKDYGATSNPGSDKETPSRRGKLRRCGIRTATSLIQAFNNAQIRKENPCDVSELQSLIDAIRTEPNLELIWNWRHLELARNCTSLNGPPVTAQHG